MCEKTCSLQHSVPENFDRSQWCPPNLVSGYYVVYRLVLALLFIGVIVVFIHLEFNDGQFFIFLTNQGLIFLTLHFSIDAILVLKRWVWEKLHSKHINCKIFLLNCPKLVETPGIKLLSGFSPIFRFYLQITRLTHLVIFTNYHGRSIQPSSQLP